MKKLVSKLKGLPARRVVLLLVVAVLFITSMLFVQNNYSLYQQPIAQVVQMEIVDSNTVTDVRELEDQVFTQKIVGQIKNGVEKEKYIELNNTYTSSGAYDQKFQIGDEVFVSIHKESNPLTGTIKDVKRDKYLLLVAWVFVISLLIIGKRQGLFAIIGLIINVAILSFALDIYVKNSNLSLLAICSLSAILFTVISLVLINGLNEKTYAAIIATLIGTFLSLFIAYFVIQFTAENGLRYEEMQFLTRPYQVVFMAGLFLGSLGGAMDIAITMSSAIFGLYEREPNIKTKTLRASGREIGKDIMGTMTNILFFVYISGSIPMIILYLSNGSTLSFTLSMNLSLEIARALAGGIGIVLTIPISLVIAIFFVNRKRAK